MGSIARAPRPVINRLYEAASGDVGDDGRTPVFLSTRADGRDAITGTDRVDGDTLTFTYRILDPALDDDDVARVYVIAHLERFLATHPSVEAKHDAEALLSALRGKARPLEPV